MHRYTAFNRTTLLLRLVLPLCAFLMQLTAPASAQITIDPLPRIVFQPLQATIGKGANVRFTVLAISPITSGAGTLRYQWYQGSTVLPGKTSATLDLTNVQAGASYYVRVRNNYGSRSSNTVALTVVDDTWAEVGGRPVATRAANDRPALALCGSPHLAWIRPSNTGVGLLYVSRFDGAGWVPVGSGVLNASASASASSPSIDCSFGRPVVAWREATGTGHNIHASAWNGSIWTQLRTVDGFRDLNFTPGSSAAAPIVRVHPQGAGSGAIATDSAIAWIEGAAVQVRRWNGSGWDSYGANDLAVSNGTNNPVSVSPGVGLNFVEPGVTDPVVAWVQPDGTGQQAVYTTFHRSGAWYNAQSLVARISAGSVASSVAVGVEKFDLFKAPVTVWTERSGSRTRILSSKMDQVEFQNPSSVGNPWSPFVATYNAGDTTAFAVAPQAFDGTPCGFNGGFPALSWLAGTATGFEVRQSRCAVSSTGWAEINRVHRVQIDAASLAMQDEKTAFVAGVQMIGGDYHVSVWRYYPVAN